MARALSALIRRTGISSESASELRSSGWLLVAAVVARVINVAAIVIVSRTLVPADLGRLTLVQSAGLVVSGIAGLGIGVAVSRQVADVLARDRAAAGRYLGAATLATVFSALVAVGLLVLGSEWLASHALRDRGLSNLVPVMAVAVGGMVVASAAQSGLLGLEAFRKVAGLQAGQAALTSIGLVAGAADGGVRGALVGFSAGQFVAAAIGLALLRRHAAVSAITIGLRLERAEAAALATFAAPAFVAAVVVSGALLGAQLMLQAQPSGYAHVAEFSVAYRWHLAILFVPAALMPAVVPVLTRLRRADHGQARETFRLTLVAGIGMAAVPAVAMALTAPLVLGLSGHSYAENPWPLVVLAAAAVPSMLNNVLSSAAISFGAVRAWLASDLAYAVGLLALAAALAPGLKASGVALAYLGGYVLTCACLAPAVARRLRLESASDS